jgi:hypothetical protein
VSEGEKRRELEGEEILKLDKTVLSFVKRVWEERVIN